MHPKKKKLNKRDSRPGAGGGDELRREREKAKFRALALLAACFDRVERLREGCRLGFFEGEKKGEVDRLGGMTFLELEIKK